MNAKSCQDVEEQLDLLAAGECDQATRLAVERHLGGCPACAARYAESQKLLGLLDLCWDERRSARLRERIEQEERRGQRRQSLLPFVRRAAALAALILLTVGLMWTQPKWLPHASEPELQLSLLASDGGPEAKMGPAIEVRATRDPAAPLKAPGAEAMAMFPAAGQIGAAFRRELLEAKRDGMLPPPPALPLALALTNAGERSLAVRLGDAEFELSLELRGQGVVRIPAVGVAEPEFLHAQTLQLAPGDQLVFRIDRLIAGARGRLEYIYLTEPGEYTLTARLRVTAGDAVVTRKSETIRLTVGN
jgi:hypothetical protein